MATNRIDPDPEVNIMVLIKGSHRYVYMYEDSQVKEILRKLGSQAARTDLSLTWKDAATMALKAQGMLK